MIIESVGEIEMPGAESAQRVELAEIQRDLQRRDTAWESYHGYDEAQQKRDDERAVSPVVIERYPRAVVIGSGNVDGEGRPLGGHSNNPESSVHSGIESEFAGYLAATPVEQRFVIYEGPTKERDSYSDRDSAIRKAADAGLTVFIADREGIPRASGEPSDLETARALVDKGVDKRELALYRVLRDLGPTLERAQDAQSDFSVLVYRQCAKSEVDGFRQYSPEERSRIAADPELLERIQNEMLDGAKKFALNELNPQLEQMGLPQFIINDRGELNMPGAVGEELRQAANPMAEGRLGDIGRLVSEYRDRHIFDTIADAVQDGKKPFVVYGGSHISALKPALDNYLTV
jgi:hypothetical protein